MSKKLKGLISILLSLIVIACLATTAFAVEPRYSDTHQLNVILSLSGTTATCTVSLIGADGTTSISDGHLTLKDSKGNVIAEWTDLSSSNSTLFVTKTVKNLTKGKTYTLYFSANVNRNGNSEPVSGSKTKPWVQSKK